MCLLIHNTLNLKEYIREQLYWIVIAIVCYSSIFFQCMPKCTFNQTWIIIVMCFINILAVNVLITIKRDRNSWNIIQTVILACGTCVLLSFWELFKVQLLFLCVGDFAISLFMIGLILFRKIKSAERRKQIIKIRIYNSVMCIRRNTAIVMLVVMTLLAVKMILFRTTLNSTVPVTKVYGDEYSLSANMHMVQGIEPSRWKQLDLNERIDVCQCIANIEGRYLGISHELNCATIDLSDDFEGYYSDATHQIVINTKYLIEASPQDIVNVITHEAYHSYQYEQVALYQLMDEKNRNLYLFYDASMYMKELADYTYGHQDYGKYYGQKIESDARRYAEIGTKYYFTKVNEYIEKHKDE